MDNSLFEEEMIRLAAELSLQEERDQENPEYIWDPNNLDSVRVKLRVYEEILDSIDFAPSEFGEEVLNNNNVLSDEDLRDIFFSAGVPEEEIRLSASTPIRTRKRDRRTQETVSMICRGLSWYQAKIVDEIQLSHETADLTGLLDLQDYINGLLDRADLIASGHFSNDATPTATPSLHLPVPISSPSAMTSPNVVAVTLSTTRHGSAQKLHNTSCVPSVVAAVYAVKRGGNRDDIAAAVLNLSQLCQLNHSTTSQPPPNLPANNSHHCSSNVDMNANVATIKQMASAGALQALLSLLPKAHDWPEIESQIFKIVSMLVSYEEDWALLQRSAMVILTSLYTLQLKSQSRARTRSIPPTMLQNNVTQPTFDEVQQQDIERQQGLLIRELVSAAIDKLSVVLSSEWSQQTNLIGNLPFLNTAHNSSIKNPSYLKRTGGNNLSGNIVGNNGNNAVGNGNNTGEADAILQIMLNLIIFIWESATSGEQSNVLPGSGNDVTSLKLLLLGYKDDSTTTVANTLFNNVHTSALLPPPLRVINNSTNVSRQQSEDVSTLLSSLPIPPPISTTNTTNSNSNNNTNNKHIASTTDEFLQRVFHVSLEQLLNGDCPPPERIHHQLIDNSAVLCSAALANLAEIPQCRPGLVARGALKLIKSWLDVCMIMLEVAKRIVFDHIHSVMNHSHFYEAFFKLFGPTYDLLTNATEALMFLAGGNHNNAHASLSSTSGGRDYIVGWVDAQILAEELPDMLVKLVMATFENPFKIPSDEQSIPSESSNRTRSVLPAIVSMNVAQTLFQLCSRTQNRHRLQGISIPFVLSMIFEHAFGYIPEVMGLYTDSPRGRRRPSAPPPPARTTAPSPKSNPPRALNTYSLDDDSSDQRLDNDIDSNAEEQEFDEEEDPIFLQIFEFGKLTLAALSDESSPYSPGMPRSMSRSRHNHNHPHHHPATARLSQTSLSMIQNQHKQQRQPQKVPPALDSTGPAHGVMLNILSCVAAATLDALNNYLADEASQQHYHGNTNDSTNSNNNAHNSNSTNIHHMATNNGPITSTGGLSSIVSGISPMAGGYLVPVDISINNNFLANAGNIHSSGSNPGNSNTHPNASSANVTTSNNVPTNFTLLELMRHARMVQALLSATSHLGKSSVGRLSCVRLISSLTEWPETLKALYDGSVMDTLLVIIYEAEDFDAAMIPLATSSTKSVTPQNASNKDIPSSGNHYHSTIDRDESSFSFFSNSGRLMPGKPSNVERNTSGNSTISGISSSVNSSIFHNRMTGTEYYNHGSNHNALGNSITEEDSTSIATCNIRQNEMLQEEMMCVCCALANLCCAQHVYAQRMFHSGLVTLMTRLVRNVHFETSRQALRCMHALAKAVVTEEDAQQMNATSKNNTPTESAGHSASQKQLMMNANNANSNSSVMGLKYAELLASLDTIMVTLSSQSVLIQIEALKTIAQLALINQEFQDKIVDECLRQIVTLLVFPKSDRDLRNAIEEVLISLGFSAGQKDFEICGYDFELLRDWYAIQRSMKPQETSMLILRDWIHRLFPTAEDINSATSLAQEESRVNVGNSPHVKSSGSFSSNLNNISCANSNNIASPGGLASPYHHSDLSAGSEFHLLQETAAILHAQVDAPTSAYLSKDHPNAHNATNAHHSAHANNAHASSHGSGKTLASLAMPQLHRHLTDSLLKLWPFCGPPKSNSNNANSNQHHNNGAVVPSSSAAAASSYSSTDMQHYMEENDYSRNKSRDSPFQSQQMNRSSLSAGNTPTSTHNNANNSNNLGGFFSASQPTVIPASTQSLLNTVAVSLSAAYNATTNNNANNISANFNTMVTSSEGNHDWIDKPPAIVVHLLDLFYTSRIHQLILMDLTSIGASIPIPNPHGDESDEYQFFSFLIPVPHPIKAVLLPSRSYPSFNRVGRVLQRMLEYNPQLLVSLTFRDCYFENEFHTTLLETLQKCPNIVSLSFANANNIEEDALLGHLVGQLPSSVRFVSFKGSLSRPSVETLCVMLRSGSNAAFVPMNNDHPHFNSSNTTNNNDLFMYQLHAQGSYLGRNIMRRPSNKTQEDTHSTTSSSTGKKKRRSSKYNNGSSMNSKLEILNNTRGLLGIALTHLSLDQNCVQKIAEMLNPKTHFVKSPFYAPYGSSGGNNGNSSNLAARRGDSNPSLLSLNHSSNPVSGANTPSSPHTSFVSSLFGGGGNSRKTAEPQIQHPPSKSTPSNRSGTPSSLRHRDSESETSSTAGYNNMGNMPGLKYLDLSHNDLHDAQCALLLSSAMKGPLEGLELGGNHIFMGQRLLDVFYDFHPERMLKHPNRIRYLGLSQNQLHVTMVTKMLNILQFNSSLTSLDLSANQLDGSVAMLNEALYDFLCNNEGLRVLNLSYNRLNTDTYRKIQLGILQNTTLLMLPIDGNPRAEIDRSLVIVQDHLKKNRLRYIAWSNSGYAVLSRNNIHNNGTASATQEHPANQEFPAFYYYQTEDVHSRLTFSEYGDFVNQGNNQLHHTELDEEEDMETSDDDLSVVTEDLSKSSKHHRLPTVTATTNDANSGAAVVAIPVAQVESTVPTVTAAAHVVSHSANTTPHHGNLTLTLPHSSYHLPTSQPTASAVSRNEDTSSLGVVHPLAPISPTVVTTTMIPALATNNMTSAAPAISRRRTTSQPPPMSSANALAYNAQKNLLLQHGSSVKLHHPTVNGNSALSAGPISMVYVPPKASQLSSASSLTAAAAAADTSLVLDSSTVYRTNTLHVLFSAPLAGYDRQGKAHPMEVLDYASERDALIQVFKEARRDVSLHFDFATTNTLRTILSFGARALHFSGHGLPNGLCFEDGRSGLQIVGATQLKDLLGAGGLSLKFVFVSACYSREIGDAFVRAGVSHVVCVKIDSKIQDSAAMAFTRAFYIAFLSGRSVKASFAIAKEALKASPYVPNSVVEGEKFVLLPDDTPAIVSPDTVRDTSGDTAGHHNNNNGNNNNKSHEEVIFAGAGMVLDWPQPGMCTIGANRMDVKVFQHFHGRLPRPPADFEGREVQMNGLVRHLLDRRLVSLVGEDGMGKSSVAAAVCRYMVDRELFKQSIVYVKGKGVHDFHSFLKKLKQELIYCGLLSSGVSQGGAGVSLLPHVSPVSTLTSTDNIISHNHSSNSSGNGNGNVPVLGDTVAETQLSDVSQPDVTTGLEVSSQVNFNSTTTTAVPGPHNISNNINNNNINNNINNNNSNNNTSSVVLEEDIIFAALRDTHLLLVFDSLDTLLGDYRGAVTDLRLFLHRLFDECAGVKVLNVGVDTLMFHNINMATANAVEYSVTLGPLTIASTLRLFARLAPSLITAQEKQSFIANLLPTKQAHCSVQSREANKCTLAILRLLGDGHPAKIVHMACESTSESVEKLTRDALKIRRQFELLSLQTQPQTHSQTQTQQTQAGTHPSVTISNVSQHQQQHQQPFQFQHGAHHPSGITAAIAASATVSPATAGATQTQSQTQTQTQQQQPFGGIMADLAAFSIVRPTHAPPSNNNSNSASNNHSTGHN